LKKIIGAIAKKDDLYMRDFSCLKTFSKVSSVVILYGKVCRSVVNLHSKVSSELTFENFYQPNCKKDDLYARFLPPEEQAWGCPHHSEVQVLFPHMNESYHTREGVMSHT